MARIAAAVRSVVEDLAGASAKAKIPRFLELKRQINSLTTEQKKIQPEIVAWLKDTIEPDASGHYVYELEEPVEGFTGLTLVRAVSNGVDDEAIREVLSEKGLLESCTTTIEVIDEDAVAQAVLDGKITEDEFLRMYPQKIQYRLTTPKA